MLWFRSNIKMQMSRPEAIEWYLCVLRGKGINKIEAMRPLYKNVFCFLNVFKIIRLNNNKKKPDSTLRVQFPAQVSKVRNSICLHF